MFTVLVVENNANQRKLYHRELTEEGYSVWLAADGREAIALLQERRPDTVVLDLHLPGGEMLGTLQGILEIDPTLPVVIYTADNTFKESIFSWLAEAFVMKSSDISPLKSTLRAMLQGARPRVEAPRQCGAVAFPAR